MMKITIKWAARVAFIAGVTALTWFNVPAAIMAVAATILVAMQSRASTLIELSFGPLRAKLEKDVSKAETLVAKLRTLAALQAKAALSVAVRTGRWADESHWQLNLLRELEASLRDLGLDEEELLKARADFVKYVISDLGMAALGETYVPSQLGQLAVSEWQEIAHKGLAKTPDEIEAYLRKWDVATPDRLERVQAMREVSETRDVTDGQFALSQKPINWQ